MPMDDDQNAGQSARINPGYASMQIAKALTMPILDETRIAATR